MSELVVLATSWIIEISYRSAEVDMQDYWSVTCYYS